MHISPKARYDVVIKRNKKGKITVTGVFDKKEEWKNVIVEHDADGNYTLVNKAGTVVATFEPKEWIDLPESCCTRLNPAYYQGSTLENIEKKMKDEFK